MSGALGAHACVRATRRAWRELRALVQEGAGARGTRSQSNYDGLDMFGLTLPVTVRLLEELPGVAKCTGYQLSAVRMRWMGVLGSVANPRA